MSTKVLKEAELTHLDDQGHARMVNVGEKPITNLRGTKLYSCTKFQNRVSRAWAKPRKQMEHTIETPEALSKYSELKKICRSDAVLYQIVLWPD